MNLSWNKQIICVYGLAVWDFIPITWGTFHFTNTSRPTLETAYPLLQWVLRGPQVTWVWNWPPSWALKWKMCEALSPFIYTPSCHVDQTQRQLCLFMNEGLGRYGWKWVWIIMDMTRSNYSEQEEVSILHQGYGCFHCHHHST